jgi:hypothetical protein
MIKRYTKIHKYILLSLQILILGILFLQRLLRRGTVRDRWSILPSGIEMAIIFHHTHEGTQGEGGSRHDVKAARTHMAHHSSGDRSRDGRIDPRTFPGGIPELLHDAFDSAVGSANDGAVGERPPYIGHVPAKCVGPIDNGLLMLKVKGIRIPPSLPEANHKSRESALKLCHMSERRNASAEDWDRESRGGGWIFV